MDPGSCPFGEPLSTAASQPPPPGGGARALGAPHSPLNPPKRLSHPPPSVTCWWGGRAAAEDPTSGALSDLCLSELWPPPPPLPPPQVRAGLRVCSATDLLREVCRSLCGWGDPRGRWRSRPRSPLGSPPPQCRGPGRAALCSPSRRPVRGAKDPPREVRRSLWSRNLPRSNTPWSLGAEFALAWSPLAVLWFVCSELCVCASFYFAILAPPPLAPPPPRPPAPVLF
ncbi:uncharacterized protein [Notamacropus eugenii]|uniref:uncharacterized protein n=1 Tax=Notamacropus eugenii TaxID=9315 RepID=UPI003B684F63